MRAFCYARSLGVVVLFPLLVALLMNVGGSRVDVVISAGHEGRPASCADFPRHGCMLGTAGERAWTPIVADEATRVLRAHGVRVARLPADFNGTFRAAAAVFLHFDGSNVPCASAASVGYRGAADVRMANAWHAFYRQYWPFGFQPDNFTRGLRDYYGYRQVRAERGSLVLELGELTCPKQRAWLAPRLIYEGDLLAYFLSRQIGKGDVPLPAKTFP